MYCKHCGKELADDAKFCPSCGGAISETVSGNKPATSPAVSVRQEKSEAEKKKPIIFGLFFANVLLALLPFIPTMQLNLTKQGFWDKEEFWEMGLGGSFSVSSLISVLKSTFEVEYKGSTNSEKYHNIIGSLNFGIIILYTIMIITVYFLCRAVKKYYDNGINDKGYRAEILSYLVKASAVSLLQLAFIFVMRVLFNNAFLKNSNNPALELTFMYIICFITVIVCLVGSANFRSQEAGRGGIFSSNSDTEVTFNSDGSWICECGSKNSSADKFCKNCYNEKPKRANEDGSWICSCGQQNPSMQMNCIKCGHLKPGEKSVVDKLLNK